jgi:hypothetical protein
MSDAGPVVNLLRRFRAGGAPAADGLCHSPRAGTGGRR